MSYVCFTLGTELIIISDNYYHTKVFPKIVVCLNMAKYGQLVSDSKKHGLHWLITMPAGILTAGAKRGAHNPWRR